MSLEETPGNAEEELSAIFLCTDRINKFEKSLDNFKFLNGKFHHVEANEGIKQWQKRLSQGFGFLSPVGAFFCFRLVWDLVLTDVFQMPNQAAFWTTLALSLPTAIGFGAYINNGMQEFFEGVVGFWKHPHTHLTWTKLRKFLFYFGIGEAFFRVITEPVLIAQTAEKFEDGVAWWVWSAGIMALAHLFMSMNEQAEPYADTIPNFIDYCSEKCCCSGGLLSESQLKTRLLKKLIMLEKFTERMPSVFLQFQQDIHRSLSETDMDSL